MLKIMENFRAVGVPPRATLRLGKLAALPKPQYIASKFQRQHLRDFRPRQARIKCRQVIATVADNRKWQCGHRNRKYISSTMTDRMTISNGKCEVFDHAQREETDPERLRQRPTTGNGNIDVLLANHVISGSRVLATISIFLVVETIFHLYPRFVVGILTVLFIFSEI